MHQLEAPTVVVVSVEKASEPGFLAYAKMLASQGTLARMVLDEAHLCLTTSSYRPAMEMLYTIRQIPVPFLYLTATLPPELENMLKVKLCAPTMRIIRGKTNRPELSLNCAGHTGDIIERALALAASLQTEHFFASAPASRGIIFCDRIAVTADLTARSDLIVAYHGKMSDEAREEAYQMWSSGTKPIVAATCAFGAGVDYPHVRFVLHLAASNSLLDFMQEIGRGGRDGELCKCTLFLPADNGNAYVQRAKRDGGMALAGASQMACWMLNQTSCRRFLLSEVMDGDGQGTTCLSDARNVPCDICQAAMAKARRDAAMPPMPHFEAAPTIPRHRRPDIHPCIRAEAGLAGQRHQRVTRMAHDIQAALNFLRGHCITCVISREPENAHHFTQCPITQALCRECYDDHRLEHCPVARLRLQFPSGSGCFKCGLPLSMCPHIFHEGNFDDCEQDEVPLVVARFIWHTQYRVALFEHFGLLPTIACIDYQRWLYKTDGNSPDHQSNASNVARVFHWWWVSSSKKV